MSEYLEKLMTPMHEFNALTLDNWEKLSALQLQAAEQSTKVWVGSLKGVSAIRDMEGLRAYATEQAEAGKELADKLFVSAGEAIALGQGYLSGVQELTEAYM